MSDTAALYRECIEAARVCVQRAKDGTIVEGDGHADEFSSVAIKSNAAAALSLIQAAVTVTKAAHEAKAASTPGVRPATRSRRDY
jgi:hypothetical protein